MRWAAKGVWSRRFHALSSDDDRDRVVAAEPRDEVRALPSPRLDRRTGRDLVIADADVENESGAKLSRPEVFRLIADSRPGDVLRIEQLDRLSRLTTTDRQPCARISTPDRAASSPSISPSWMLDVLAAVAREDAEDRRRR